MSASCRTPLLDVRHSSPGKTGWRSAGGWRIIEPALQAHGAPLEYAAGSWGPEAADELLGTSHAWHVPEVRS